jgi:hypothetical protein
MKFAWAAELAKWRPELSVQVVGKAKDRLTACDVTIVNYDILDKLDLPVPATLVADESH